jgi:murein DD-endopeptidase MepM/ murein hydrolase activator NlpD
MSRFHPVLKRRMPHYGVDYGAPVGTPVHATADGTVSFVGTQSGAGRMVRVRHPNGYETHYLHLSRYGGGIRSGVRVTQGQVLGYVGSTGLSTGPHLDYRVKQNGRWVNPLTITSPPAEPLSVDRLQRFLAHSLAVLELLEGREPPIGARS